MLCEDPGVKPLPTSDSTVGIDLGLEHLLVLSTGEKSLLLASGAGARPRSPDLSALCPANRQAATTGPKPA
jgi:transposase